MKFSIQEKSYGNRRVLSPMMLEVEPARVTALMGPSGSGKTTLLRIIAGLEKDDAGSTQPDLKIGMMFQDPQLLPWKTLRENIEIAGPPHNLLEELGLSDAANLYPRQISLGMARRAAFARALAIGPELLILDEPFASLDLDLISILREKILSVAVEKCIPVLITTHQKSDVSALQAKYFYLEGAPAELKAGD